MSSRFVEILIDIVSPRAYNPVAFSEVQKANQFKPQRWILRLYPTQYIAIKNRLNQFLDANRN